MSSDWYAYKTKGGNTLFFYNTKTGKHIWANHCSNRLQFEFINNGFEDRNGKCALSKGTCKENPSHWRPYTLKSGDVLFYYNIITGEHKWDMNFNLSNSSSIPSEPVLLKYDIDGEGTSESMKVDQNGNTIHLATTDYTGVKTGIDENATAIESDLIQHNLTLDQSENSPENQFLRKPSSIETNSNFMALRSTLRSRDRVSHVDSREACLQERNMYYEEHFSDTSSSSEDNCSNFSDELPEISTSESEEEQVEEERARIKQRRSKYDVEKLTENFSSGPDNVDCIVQRRGEKYTASELRPSSFMQNGSSLSENSKGREGVTKDQEKIAFAIDRISLNGSERYQVHELRHASLQQNTSTFEQGSANNRILLTRYEQEGRSSPFRLTGQDRMPKIDDIFSMADSSNQEVEKANLEKYQERVDSMNRNTIYEPGSVKNSETSSVGVNNLLTHQNNSSVLGLNLSLVNNSQSSCTPLTREGSRSMSFRPVGIHNHPQCTMPTIEDVFSLPKNTTNLVVKKVSYEKGDKNIDSTKFDYEASQFKFKDSIELQEIINQIQHSMTGEKQETLKLCSETMFTLRNYSSTASESLPMGRSSEERPESNSNILSPIKGKDNEGRPNRESEDGSVKQDVDNNSPRSGTTWAMENTWAIMQTDKDAEQEDDETATVVKSLESKEENTLHRTLTIGKEQYRVEEVMDSEHVQHVSGNTDHPDENSCMWNKGELVDISSDETLPRRGTTEEVPTIYQNEEANPDNVSYRYHYSIKCLLPMIGNTLNQAETLRASCHNRRPTMILSSQYISVLPTAESMAPATAFSKDKGDIPRTTTSTNTSSDPSIFATNSSERNRVLTSLPATAIKQEQPETNHNVFNKRRTSIETLTPDSSYFANDSALETSVDSNDLLSSLMCFGVSSLSNGLPTVVEEHVQSSYKCYYCSKDFCFQELKRHLALRHLLFGGVFLCNSCDDSFFSQEEFSQHLLLHDEIKPVKCRHCDIEFVTVEELASHMASHLDEPKYPKYAKRRTALELVGKEESQHQDGSQKTINSDKEDKPEKRRRCSDCDKDFRHYFALRLHLRTHGKENNHLCLLCGNWYLDLKSLRKHVVIHLREKRLECDICHKIFRFHSDYLQHGLVHVPGQLFRCERRGCRELFNTWDELRQHEIVIHEEKRYRCTECGKSFSRQEKLIWHLRLHTGEKPLECQKCGQRFRTRVVLRNHEKIHLDFKTFNCNVCNKGFKQKCSMLRHLKTHSAIPKGYLCNICKKHFTQSCSLQRHMRIHSGEKFKCPKCPMKFLEAWRMRIHIKNKHSEE